MTRRTRTTAVLLLGVAVGGVSACVAVEPVAGAGGGAVREASPAVTVAPRIAQPPAREALEAAGAPYARTPPPKPPAVSEAVRPPPEPPRRRAAVQRSVPPAPAPSVPAPPVALPDTGAELCALGERYGGWTPDSQVSRVCARTYGG
ncbi:hypothetical protein [Streptomyces sp. NPDC058653]|uniref:hypothetical protein n=1 Tax=Streptomyces sp. NPDC058653 TaxID=3346576 RepID=UPI0036472337